MKKILLFLLLLTGNLCFASVIIKQDISTCGAEFNVYYNSKYQSEKYCNFSSFREIAFSLLWEFGSHNDNNIHFYTGADLGFCSQGFPITGTFGAVTKMFETNILCFELDTGIKAGTMEGIKIGYYLYFQPYIDFIMMPRSRNGFYIGLGLTNNNYCSKYFFNGYLGGHIVFGLRLF